MERKPRLHPWLVDGTLAAVLVAGSANNYAGQLNLLPVTLALAGTVALRRRFPVAASAAALAIGAAQVILGTGPVLTHSPLQPTLADFGLLILVYTVATVRPRRVSVPVLACCMVLFAAAVMRWSSGSLRADGMTALAVAGLPYLLAPVSAWVLGDSMAYRRAYLAAMEERAVRAEAERDAQARVAAAAERARIARELHDVIAHNLSVIVAQADGGRYIFDAEPEKSRQALAQISGTGRQALSEMSHLLGVLRTGNESAPPALSPPAPFTPAPGIGDITRLAAQAQETGMRVTAVVEGTARPVPDSMSLAVYRMVQEALTNVRKHAGPGAAAEVTLRYGRDALSVSVVDDGSAAGSVLSGSGPGHGLAGMRERAALYGGRVTAGPRPGGGFEVTAWLPLPDDASQDAA